MSRENYPNPPAVLATIPVCQGSNGEADWFPPVDILEDAEEYVFKVDLPETKPEDIKVVVEEDGLFISGERPPPRHEEQRPLRLERPHGHFERRFALPDDASRADINSRFSESVLELHVRKVRPLRQEPVATDVAPKLKLRRAS